MTNLDKIIKTRKVPKDELNRFWNNLSGFLPSLLFLMAGVGPIIAPRTTVPKNEILIIFIIGLLILIYTIYSKITERNLKFIETKLSKENNEKLIIDISLMSNWKKLSNKSYYHSFFFPFVKFHYGFKLILIPIDKGILINLRNRGTVQGRMPYSFGVETFKQIRIEQKIKNYTQQCITTITADSTTPESTL